MVGSRSAFPRLGLFVLLALLSGGTSGCVEQRCELLSAGQAGQLYPARRHVTAGIVVAASDQDVLTLKGWIGLLFQSEVVANRIVFWDRNGRFTEHHAHLRVRLDGDEGGRGKEQIPAVHIVSYYGRLYTAGLVAGESNRPVWIGYNDRIRGLFLGLGLAPR
jgi:hypothetical protein